ncbi:3-phenylpropionate/trans-cinnamate dioxygenase ferredoxin reductase subunit [Bradyrhizobium sp. RT9b]|uniref:NAD(P)/FAD-dependent oxidoreductase n=1 Tax=Bradyrhizobium sp. RT9b TaxID=3156385 RepID=UPI003390FA11
MRRQQLLVIGGSYAACELAAHARECGYDEDILLVSEEPELPYHRPPLSKGYLKSPSVLVDPLRAAAFYSANSIDLELGLKVVSLDSGAQTALLSNGKHVSFDVLCLAVGARPRRLSCQGADLRNVFYLRSIADARCLKAAAADAERIVIIGAGFIGLEVAAALVQQQKWVTVIETESRVLARVASPEVSEFLHSVHFNHGVHLVTSRAVQSLVGEDGVVRKVVLTDGTSIDADIVIGGIGSIPNLELTEPLGLHTSNGIVVDATSCTSRSNVFAAGDCTVFRGPYNPSGIRLESVQNAIDQSRVAGAAIAGVDKTYESLPWFWSDQYDLRLQMAGVSVGATERIVRAGPPDGISVFHFRNDDCICVESVNRPREHVSSRRLLAREKISKGRLQEVDFDVSALLKAK